MDFASISTSHPLPNLMPPIERTLGPDVVHISDCVHHIAVRQGLLDADSNLPPAYAQLGSSMEAVLAARFEERFPNRYFTPGELEVDGIYMTPDLLDLQRTITRNGEIRRRRRAVPVEIKLAWMGPQHTPDSAKWWRYRAQLMGYCWSQQSEWGELWVTHVVQAVWNPVEFLFTYRELQEHWRLIQSTATVIRRERALAAERAAAAAAAAETQEQEE